MQVDEGLEGNDCPRIPKHFIFLKSGKNDGHFI